MHGGAQPDPISSDVSFPAPATSAAQGAQPFALGGDHRAELASPEPQHQSRSSPKAAASPLSQPQKQPHQPKQGALLLFSAVPLGPCPPRHPASHRTPKAGVEGRPCSASKAHSLSPCTAHRQNRVPEPLHQEEVCTLMASQARTRGSPREVERGGGDGGPERAPMGLRVGLQAQ